MNRTRNLEKLFRKNVDVTSNSKLGLADLKYKIGIVQKPRSQLEEGVSQKVTKGYKGEGVAKRPPLSQND